LGAFAARVALRYPLSGAIEYRNEPNVLGAGGQPKASPAAYVAGLRAVYQSVKKAGSRIRILGGSLADGPNWLDYLDSMLSEVAAVGLPLAGPPSEGLAARCPDRRGALLHDGGKAAGVRRGGLRLAAAGRWAPRAEAGLLRLQARRRAHRCAVHRKPTHRGVP